jgi:hypothetical protein
MSTCTAKKNVNVFIGPRPAPFEEEVEDFWDQEGTSESDLPRNLDTDGRRQCVIGTCPVTNPDDLHTCYIIRDSHEWEHRQTRPWVPATKRGPHNYPRNALLMCRNHHASFINLMFFIRYNPEDKQYYFVNASGRESLETYHGQTCKFDGFSKDAAHPNLLLYHERKVRVNSLMEVKTFVVSNGNCPSLVADSESVVNPDSEKLETAVDELTICNRESIHEEEVIDDTSMVKGNSDQGTRKPYKVKGLTPRVERRVREWLADLAVHDLYKQQTQTGGTRPTWLRHSIAPVL